MKAVVYEKYGPPEVLEFKEVDKPVPKDNEILVKVFATTVTAGDWRMRSANPFLARLYNGLFKPSKVKILGFELAGMVETIGKNVIMFKPGDAVFANCGFKFGAYAEYKSLPENDSVALKPSNMTFEEAATVPIGGLTALRFLKKVAVKKGDTVLIYGASGSVGTFAVQLAKYYGATVTGICSSVNIGLVQSLGADRVIDYTREDFTQTTERYNVVFDAVGKASKTACKKLLKPAGRYTSVSANPKRGTNELGYLKTLIEAGHLKTVIDRKYSWEQIREAHAYVQQFHKKGNVVVKISSEASSR